MRCDARGASPESSRAEPINGTSSTNAINSPRTQALSGLPDNPILINEWVPIITWLNLFFYHCTRSLPSYLSDRLSCFGARSCEEFTQTATVHCDRGLIPVPVQLVTLRVRSSKM